MSRYEKGARLERKVKADLEGCGYVVYRAAGSKGSADLIALREGETLLVQVKTSNAVLGRVERLRLLTEALFTGSKAVLATTGPHPTDGRRTVLRLFHVVGKGPKDLVEFEVMPS